MDRSTVPASVAVTSLPPHGHAPRPDRLNAPDEERYYYSVDKKKCARQVPRFALVFALIEPDPTGTGRVQLHRHRRNHEFTTRARLDLSARRSS